MCRLLKHPADLHGVTTAAPAPIGLEFSCPETAKFAQSFNGSGHHPVHRYRSAMGGSRHRHYAAPPVSWKNGQMIWC
jgi:hypothetical protein